MEGKSWQGQVQSRGENTITRKRDDSRERQTDKGQKEIIARQSQSKSLHLYHQIKALERENRNSAFILSVTNGER